MRAAAEAMSEEAAKPRELFDTLLKWSGRVRLDSNGEATVEVPINDSLTQFGIVAIASSGVDRFGTGETKIRSVQPLQLLSGLPPLVREGDRYRALVTVRNTSKAAMDVVIGAASTRNDSGKSSTIAKTDLRVALAPGESREVRWSVEVPSGVERIDWTLTAMDATGRERDALKLTQKVVPAVPVGVQQATLIQLDRPPTMKVALPPDALPGRGGVSIAVRPRIAEGLEEVRRFMADYPFICLEQKVSKAVALRDRELWDVIAREIATHLDGNGLARYFPSGREGSDVLTAYVLAVAHEAGWEIPPEPKARMEAALVRFVRGELSVFAWSPRADHTERKLSAIEALARGGKADAAMLAGLKLDPNQSPTSAVIDLLSALSRITDVPERARVITETEQILRVRLTLQGTTMGFSTERSDYWWWMMASPDANAVRAILTLMPHDAWREDIPRMVRGALARQKNGHWNTTIANVWGVLAMEKFSARFESTPVTERTDAALGGSRHTFDWQAAPQGGQAILAWPAGVNTAQVAQQGTGRPWLTVQSLAAIPLKAPFVAGYRIEKSISAIQRKIPGKWTRGDVLRVKLEVDAQSDMTWVVISDPIPAGATLLGRGLARDSQILGAAEQRAGWTVPVFEERAFDAFRAYYHFVPKGKWSVEYTLWPNNEGTFALPQTRVEAMHSPEMFGERPNERIVVE